MGEEHGCPRENPSKQAGLRFLEYSENSSQSAPLALMLRQLTDHLGLSRRECDSLSHAEKLCCGRRLYCDLQHQPILPSISTYIIYAQHLEVYQGEPFENALPLPCQS